jgi:predicted DNA-binding mobile mystery protein A
VYSNRLISSRNLDRQLPGLHQLAVKSPGQSWVRTIRSALGMSTVELAMRMRVTRSRVSQIERAEMDETIHLPTLVRAAEALNCRLVYFLVPAEPLEQMVWRQAFLKASDELGAQRARKDEVEDVWTPRGGPTFEEEAESRAYSLVSSRWLWS